MTTTTSNVEDSRLYAIISLIVIWTDYMVRTYIRIKAALDAVIYVAQSPTPRQQQRKQSFAETYTVKRQSTTSRLTPVHRLPNEVLQLVWINTSKNDLFHCTMVCQRWHRLVTPLLWKDPILPSSLPGPISHTQLMPTISHDTAKRGHGRHPSSSSSVSSSSTFTSSTSSSLSTTSTCTSHQHQHHHHHRRRRTCSGISLPLPRVILSLRSPKYGHAVQSLKLSTVSECLTDDLLLYITQHCPNLTVLDLSYAQKLTSSGYQHLARSACAPSLTHLTLSFCPQLTDASLGTLSMRCDSLETIHLVGCHRITQKGVRSLVAASRQSLQYINMKDCIRVSGRILQDLAVLCGPRLLGVDASRICSILHSDIKCLVLHCPHLEQLYLGRNKSQLLCQLQQRIRNEQGGLAIPQKKNQRVSSSLPVSPSSSPPRPFSNSLSASLLQQRQLSRSLSSSSTSSQPSMTQPNALDSLLDMLRHYNVNPVETSTSVSSRQQREHRSRHLSQPVWQYKNNNNINNSNNKNKNNNRSSTNDINPMQHPQHRGEDEDQDADEVSQATVELMLKHLTQLRAVDFSHWTCLTDQFLRRLRQHQGHAIQYIGLDGCSTVTQTSSSSILCDV